MKPETLTPIKRINPGDPISSLLYSILITLRDPRERVWVAGGFARRCMEGYGQWDGDIDVYVADEQARDMVEARMGALFPGATKELLRGVIQWKLNNDPGMHIEGGITLQLIHYNYYTSMDNVVSSFDFTINQGAFSLKSSGFIYLYGTQGFIDDVPRRILRPVKYRSVKSFMKRYTKFVRQGYYAPDDILQEIAERLSTLPTGGSEEGYSQDVTF